MYHNLKQLIMKRPTIIAVEGNIGTGKSTLLNKLKNHIDSSKIIFCQEPIDEWTKIKNKNGETILNEFYNDPKKYSFSFQIMILKTMNDLLQNTIKNNPQCEMIICERSFLSSRYVFTKMLYNDGLMNDIEYQIYEDIFDSWYTNYLIPDKIIYLYSSTEICLQRIQKRSRNGENNIGIEYLQKCNDHYRDFLVLFNGYDLPMIPILKIDVENDIDIDIDIESKFHFENCFKK